MRRLSGCLLIAIALGGCGGDDEGRVEADTTPRAPAPTTAAPPTAPPPETREREAEAPAATRPDEAGAPEQVPGGAGDEIPASSQALLTGRGGKVTPRVVLVPPFIAVRVELRSADGRDYVLRGAGKTIKVGGSTTLDGLRPGKRYVLRHANGRVVIEASAEPGP